MNPNIVRAQMESGIVFGLSAALAGALYALTGEPVSALPLSSQGIQLA